jgi:hypothetical protein
METWTKQCPLSEHKEISSTNTCFFNWRSRSLLKQTNSRLENSECWSNNYGKRLGKLKNISSMQTFRNESTKMSKFVESPSIDTSNQKYYKTQKSSHLVARVIILIIVLIIIQHMTKTIETWKNYNPFIKRNRIASIRKQSSKSSHQPKTPLNLIKSRNRPASKIDYFLKLTELGMITYQKILNNQFKNRDKLSERLSPWVRANNEFNREHSNDEVDTYLLYCDSSSLFYVGFILSNWEVQSESR